MDRENVLDVIDTVYGKLGKPVLDREFQEEDMPQDDFFDLVNNAADSYNLRNGVVWDNNGDEPVEYSPVQLMEMIQTFEPDEDPVWDVFLYREDGETVLEAGSNNYVDFNLPLPPDNAKFTGGPNQSKTEEYDLSVRAENVDWSEAAGYLKT